jgi:hypothetical protein
MTNLDQYREPTDAELDAAEKRLNFPFHPAYRAFLKSCGNVGNALYEPALIVPGAERRLDLFEIAKTAWETERLPRDLLPFIEDNADYFCLTRTGGVRFWSHNGATNEAWDTFAEWYQQACVDEPKQRER